MLLNTRPTLMLSSKAVLERARDVFSVEADALKFTSDCLNDSFFNAVKLITETQGKVILMGVGKSALIAQKIAATFSSLGTPAMFVHAGDSMHGDLGVVQSQDIVIILSLTGSTPEIVSALPNIQRLNCPIIGISAAENSPLAAAAKILISLKVEKEACSLNLAPTSSTTAMLVMGDALAIVVSEAKGFQAQDFARYHPGGALGRKLLWRVKDVMHPHSKDHLALKPDTPIDEIISALTRARLGAVNIIDSTHKNKLIGVITDGDIRRATQRKEEFFKLKAMDIMTKNPVSIRSDVLVSEAVALMENRPSQISVLSVVDEAGQAIGLVRIHDLL